MVHQDDLVPFLMLNICLCFFYRRDFVFTGEVVQQVGAGYVCLSPTHRKHTLSLSHTHTHIVRVEVLGSSYCELLGTSR